MANLNSITPCFIVSHLKHSVDFYVDKLGFELSYMGPEEDPYFAMVGRDNISLMLKGVSPDVQPIPNHTRHKYAPWDAYVHVSDPDTLYSEYLSNDVHFHKALHNNSDHLRGFEIKDADGYLLYFGRPEPK
jgi:catechol 2,3-dioxygenase-like lactoylglutathione lyase family enzyme